MQARVAQLRVRRGANVLARAARSTSRRRGALSLTVARRVAPDAVGEAAALGAAACSTLASPYTRQARRARRCSRHAPRRPLRVAMSISSGQTSSCSTSQRVFAPTARCWARASSSRVARRDLDLDASYTSAAGSRCAGGRTRASPVTIELPLGASAASRVVALPPPSGGRGAVAALRRHERLLRKKASAGVGLSGDSDARRGLAATLGGCRAVSMRALQQRGTRRRAPRGERPDPFREVAIG